MPHYIEYCKLCQEVISQCRCPSSDKEVRWGLCCECKKAIGEGNILEDECQPGDIIESRNGNLFLIKDKNTAIALGNKTLEKREEKDRATIPVGRSVCRKIGSIDLKKYIDGQKVNW